MESIVIFLMIAMSVLVIVAVVYRKSGMSLSWYDEVASVMLAWLTYYASALAALAYVTVNNVLVRKAVKTVYGNDNIADSEAAAIGLIDQWPDLGLIMAPTTEGIKAAAKVVTDDGERPGRFLVIKADGGQLQRIPIPVEPAVRKPAPPAEPGLYRWVDSNGVAQFGENPPPEYAESAVKVMDLE